LALKRFDLAAASDPSASHVSPAPGTTASGTNTNAKENATLTRPPSSLATWLILSLSAITQSRAASSLDWGIDEAPLDVGVHLDMDYPDRPLCHIDCENDESSSDDDSIFVDFSRD
jgi:hypothetical protein